MNHSQAVVITGIGTISPVGLDINSSWKQLIAGQSGIDFISAFDTTGFETTFAGEVKGFDPENYTNFGLCCDSVHRWRQVRLAVSTT